MIDRVYEAISRPVPARPVGMARIVIGIAALIRAVEGIRILSPLFDPITVRLPYVAWLPDPDRTWVVGLLAVWISAAAAFTLGWKTRWAGSLLAVAILGVLLLDQQSYSNHLYLMVLLVVLLTAADSGAALSLDTRHVSRSTVPAGPVLLMKLQISIVYLFAGLTKINDPFLSGGVIAGESGTGVVSLPEALETPEVLAPIAGLVVVTEVFLAVALWLPRVRPLAFVVGFGFHMSIVLFVGPFVQLSVFAMEMLAVYVLFLGIAEASRGVVFDDSCGFCQSSVQWLRRGDWLNAHRFVPTSDRAARTALGVSQADADHELQLVSADGRFGGFDAVGRALEALPITFLVAPVLRIRPVVSVGRWLYRRVAARRKCRATLTADTA